VRSWRTCNNRRRRKALPFYRWWPWIIYDEAAPPLTLDKMRAIIQTLNALDRDLLNHGIAITKDGERVDPKDFYA
jgi:hypothetical protein